MPSKTLFIPLFLASSILAAKTDLTCCTLTTVPLLTEVTMATGTNDVAQAISNFAYTTFLVAMSYISPEMVLLKSLITFTVGQH